MTSAFLIRGGLVVDWLPALSVEPDDLVVAAGRIDRRGRDLEPQGALEIDARGRLVMPGWIIAHHHLYSALARGMPPPPRAPQSFHEILRFVWWVLDRCLDDESIRTSALVGGLDALAAGATFIVDHHASPNAIGGSLDRIAEALVGLGLRSCLAYEVSDRDGLAVRDAGLAENRRFTGVPGWSWPFPGAHASFTLSDDTLARCAELGRVHVHLLEDPCDRDLSRSQFGASPVERFDRAGLLGPGSLFGHGIHLTDDELALLVARGARLAYNPRSNANNGVGTRTLDRYRGIACLGTDGMDSDLWTEIRLAFLTARAGGVGDAMSPLLTTLQNNYRLARDLSGLALGSLAAGAPADLMIVDPRTPTPLHASNLLGHLTFGMGRHSVQHVMVDGRWRLWDGRVTAPSADGVLRAARPVAQRLWERMGEVWRREIGA